MVRFLTILRIIFHLYSQGFPALQVISKFANECSETLSCDKFSKVMTFNFGKNYMENYDVQVY